MNPPICPRCGATMMSIVYGYPGPDLVEAAERGEVILGGCIIEPGQAEWACRICTLGRGQVTNP